MSFSPTGLNVPSPTCNNTFVTITPFALICSKSSGVKCNPAVGAAAEPSTLAYTVLYLSLNLLGCALIYGGSGITPTLSKMFSNTPSNLKLTIFPPKSVSDTTVRLSSGEISIIEPTFARLPGLIKTSQSVKLSLFKSKISIFALVSLLTPYSLAGITFVLFTTSTSPGFR